MTAPTSEAPVSSHGKSLTFIVGGEALALSAGEVTEIIRLRRVTRVPHGPVSLLGVLNLRGMVLPVVSLSQLLGHGVAAPSPSSRVVVVDKGAPVGLLVDEVSSLAESSDQRRIDLDSLLARDFSSLMRRSTAKPAIGIESQTAKPELARRERALVGFEIAGQEYALPLADVAEVTAFDGEVAGVPRTDQAMIGVMARHGGLLPLVSMRVLLGLPAQAIDRARARIVVTHLGNALVGLVTDGMKAILRVPEDSIDPVPPVLTRGRGESQIEAICRLDQGRRLISILSPARLFDSETAARILAESEQGISQMTSTETQVDHGETEKFVVFRLGDEHYGLPIAAVNEVVRRPGTLTRVPHAPAFVEGVMNLRGRIVPVIDQRRRFDVAGESGARRRIVVVTIDGLQAGFAVDSVSEILGLQPGEMSAAPELTAGDVPMFDRIATIERDGRMILLVDPKALLDRAERDLLAAIAADRDAAIP